MNVLAVNAGSSSLKFAVHPVFLGVARPAALVGSIEGLESDEPARLTARIGERFHHEVLEGGGTDPFEQAIATLQGLLRRESAGNAMQAVQAVAHRVVHGGDRFREAVLVTEPVLQQLASLSALAPLHQPRNVMGLRAFDQAFAHVPQVACFDTAFHVDMPEVEYRFALPQAMARQGIRRYGFHGLSYQYVAQTLGRRSDRAQARVVMAHLGNGASLCAMLGGKSQATSMGFSALDGLMMGTRSGSLDPGVLLHLQGQGWDHAQLQDLLYRQSGLLGVSGLSADMRRLRGSDQPQARLAIDMFTYRVTRECGAMAACIGGMDVLAFTGGIGEHDPVLRAAVCDRLAFLGVRLDPGRNGHATGDQVASLHASDSSVEVWMVPTDEGRVAAQMAATLLGVAPAT